MMPLCYYVGMSRKAMPVVISESDRDELRRWISAHMTPQQVAVRCPEMEMEFEIPDDIRRALGF